MLERIITALVLVAVVLTCMFATSSHYPMFGLMIVAAGVAGYEWFKLMPRDTALFKPKAWAYGLIVALISALALYYNEVAILLWCASILTWLVSSFWVKAYPEYDGWYNASLYLLGLILVSAAVTAIFEVWQSSPWWYGERTQVLILLGVSLVKIS